MQEFLSLPHPLPPHCPLFRLSEGRIKNKKMAYKFAYVIFFMYFCGRKSVTYEKEYIFCRIVRLDDAGGAETE